MTFVSVCIPTYSRLDYLKETVQSILEQTYKNFEICISQDPKKDGPDLAIKSWCEKMQEDNPLIRYHLNLKNLGLSGNWNKLVTFARGNYLIILGDDDKLSPNYIERFVEAITSTNADVGFCDQYFIDAGGKVDKELTETNSVRYHRYSLPAGIIAEPIKTVLQNTVPMSAALISKHWLLQFPFDTKLNTPELEVFLRIAVAGGSFYYINERLAFYRVHSTSATSSGLTVHKLVSNLISIEVPSEYELLKYKLITGQIGVAVNRYLKEGDKKNASLLFRSKYYPRDNKIYRFFQNILLHTPSFIISLIKR